MHNRNRMRASNLLVREWLLSNNYDEIWFKPHGKHNDYVYTPKGVYMAQDIWNLFDGIAIASNGVVTFLQMSTTHWHPKEKYEKFVKRVRGVQVKVFLVTNKRKECERINKNGKVSKIRDYKVYVREYQ